MKKLSLSIIIVTICLAGCSHEITPEQATLTRVGQAAPSFAVTTLDGENFSLDAQQGRIVLVNFWATWCPPCREEIPRLENEVWQQFKDAGLSMIAISREEDEATVRKFAESTTMSFPLAVDPDRSIYGLYAESTIPRNIVIGPEGQILHQSYGYEEREFDHMIEIIHDAVAALDEKAMS